jgi:two-component system KDP operon response regulator KdpE
MDQKCRAVSLASPASQETAMAETLGRILVVDDESSMRRVLRLTLAALGFSVGEEPNGERAIERLRAEPFDAVLLDSNMPGMGGVATCRMLRRQYPVLGILMLTVRDRPEDRIEAFGAGADDYVAKPFDLPELIARLKVAVRRAQAPRREEPLTIRIGELELNCPNRSLKKGDQPVHLTPNEFALLRCLMSQPGALVRYAELFRAVWELDGIRDPRRLRSLVRQVRRKIEPNPAKPTYLLSERGFGYRFGAVSGDQTS